MSLFKKDPEGALLKEQRKKAKREKDAIFRGETLQSIGTIPSNANVELGLNPENQTLVIKYRGTVKIQLPYDRIVGFKNEISDISQRSMAADVTTSLAANLMPRKIRTVGRLAGDYISEHIGKKHRWIGTLVYKDKDGCQQEIGFIEKHGNEYYKEEDCSFEARNFEEVLGNIAYEHRNGIVEL